MRTDQINVILLIALISWGTAQILKTLRRRTLKRNV